MAVLSALGPIGKGLVFAAIGYLIGAGLGIGLSALSGRADPGEPTIALGYLFALPGWLMGVGMWDQWAREWFGLKAKVSTAKGWQRYFAFNTDHKVVGVQYTVTFILVMLLAGSLAMLMRWELMTPGRNIMGPIEFATTMSLHGILMVAVAVAAIIGGFANFTVPLLIGAEDVAFPRLNALSFWIVPPVAVLLLLSPLFGGFDSGWTAYPPLSVVNATGQLFFLLAFLTFGFSSILGALNFLTTITTLRAPGMTWGRIPIFVWSIFAASLISLTATQFVAYGLIMVILERVAGMAFFDATRGGAPLLYQHVFWFYTHPAVYIMILPGFGAALEVLAHFSRKPVFAYKWAAGAFLAIVGLSFIVWAHHMFVSGMPNFLHLPFMVTTELISIPTGVVFLAAIGTIWQGRLWLKTPMLFALGFVFNFLVGGITGIYLADVPTDIQLQNTYFVVAHFHYTIMGGEIFGLMAGLYYWFPKITGRMYNEKLGKLHFWWMIIAYNLTFIPMFAVGLKGMNRRVFDYPASMADLNLFISISAFMLGASFLVMVFNLVRAWIRGPAAGDNPWRATTLEWQTSSPPPLENFPRQPVVAGNQYDYGVPSATSAPKAAHTPAGPQSH